MSDSLPEVQAQKSKGTFEVSNKSDAAILLMMLLGILALVFSIRFPGGRYALDILYLQAAGSNAQMIYKGIVIAIYIGALLVAETLTKKTNKSLYSLWVKISSVLILISLITNIW